MRASFGTLHSLMAFMSRSFIFSLVEYSGSSRTLKQVWAEGSLHGATFICSIFIAHRSCVVMLYGGVYVQTCPNRGHSLQ